MLPPDGEQAFQKQYSAAKKRFDAIRHPTEGEKANKDSKEDQNAIDMAARYYTYRLTWGDNDKAGEVNKLIDEFNSQVGNADSDAMRKGNPAFTEMYLKSLALRAREVMQTKQPIAAVNAARMLVRLTEAGSEEAGDACLDAVKNANGFLEPKAEAGVRYYALRGLRNLLARWAEAPPADGAPAAPAGRKEKEENYVQALVQVIERKPPTGVVPPSPEEVAGMQVFRREAVRALAQYHAPALADAKGNIKLPSGLTLLKVVNSDGLSPRARLDEQIEAAVGVARFQSKALASYQPDYAAHQIGYLVVEMGGRARPLKEDTSKFPWKAYAARLADALEAMRADVKAGPDKEAAPFVEQLVGRALRVLKDIEVAEKANAADLKFWLDSTRPPHNTLYKGMADSTVRPLEAGEKPEAPEEKPNKPDEKKPDDKKPGDKPKKPDDKKPDGKKPG
jgi:hypothetical protein